MKTKILKFLAILIISMMVCLPAGSSSKNEVCIKPMNYSYGYIYVRVYKDSKWYTYVYESDGVTLVTIIEEEW